jgi:acetyl esterase/lipase
MRVVKFLPVALVASVLAGCNSLKLYNFLQAGGYAPDFADLAYGADPRQRLDLYLPPAAAAPAPLLVWFYGGGWDSGDKAAYAFVARRFTGMGYAVAIPDYRLVPQVQFPAFIEDCAAALGRLKAFANERPGLVSAQPMVLAGHSAGAYNAVQLVAGPGYLAQVGMTPADIAGIVGLSGPYDFYPYRVEASRAAFGDAPAQQSQPVAQDLSRMPPLLLITGDSDDTVLPRNSIRLAELAPEARLQVIDGVGHIGTLTGLGRFLTTDDAVLAPVTAFLNALGR